MAQVNTTDWPLSFAWRLSFSIYPFSKLACFQTCYIWFALLSLSLCPQMGWPTSLIFITLQVLPSSASHFFGWIMIHVLLLVTHVFLIWSNSWGKCHLSFFHISHIIYCNLLLRFNLFPFLRNHLPKCTISNHAIYEYFFKTSSLLT